MKWWIMIYDDYWLCMMIYHLKIHAKSHWMKRGMMIFYPGFLGRDPSHQEWDARCQGLLLLILWSLWFPLPLARRLLQGLFQTKSIWQLKFSLPGSWNGRCSMRVPDRSETHHWVPCNTILAWNLWQVFVSFTLWNTQKQIQVQIHRCLFCLHS